MYSTRYNILIVLFFLCYLGKAFYFVRVLFIKAINMKSILVQVSKFYITYKFTIKEHESELYFISTDWFNHVYNIFICIHIAIFGVILSFFTKRVLAFVNLKVSISAKCLQLIGFAKFVASRPCRVLTQNYPLIIHCFNI